uniref:Peptidase S1 domain-containing protein n=1 Tax=Zosterops lateralis melanops TaxID=1220523 RepID=A0A8D2P6D5_ZOSLA
MQIIGGQEVEPHSRLYVAYLEHLPPATCPGGLFLCPMQLLLVFPGRKLNITVILGAHNVHDREQSQQRIDVRQWVIHPEYSRVGFQNDIVLLKLQSKARINEDVQTTCIPLSKEHVREGAECEVAGWGQTSLTWNKTNVMREVELKVRMEEICQKEFKKYKPQPMICFGDDYSKKATYHGDSGGPLICNQKAHGIASYGPKGRLYPEVFTRVLYFEPWIHEQLRRFSLQNLPCSPSSD